MTKISIYDALHPKRKKAIKIIEAVIEPLLDRISNKQDKKYELSGENYYKIEDDIVNILK